MNGEIDYILWVHLCAELLSFLTSARTLKVCYVRGPLSWHGEVTS